MLLRNGKKYEYNPNPLNKKNNSYSSYKKSKLDYFKNMNSGWNILKILSLLSILPISYISSFYLYNSIHHVYDNIVAYNDNSFKNINNMINEYNTYKYSTGLYGERCLFKYDNLTYLYTYKCATPTEDNNGFLQSCYNYLYKEFYYITVEITNYTKLLYQSVYSVVKYM
jgi:hypothetical protein